MEWKDPKLLEESGPLLLSIQKTVRGGVEIFKYVGYFDVETGGFYRYDPFIKNGIGEEIKNVKILGWTNGPPVFLG